MVNKVKNLFKKEKGELPKNQKKGITIFQKSNSNIPEKNKFVQVKWFVTKHQNVRLKSYHKWEEKSIKVPKK